MFNVFIPDMVTIRRNETELILKGKRTRGLRRAERLALIGAHTVELMAFDMRIDVEVTPTTQYLGAGCYAPVVMVRIVH